MKKITLLLVVIFAMSALGVKAQKVNLKQYSEPYLFVKTVENLSLFSNKDKVYISDGVVDLEVYKLGDGVLSEKNNNMLIVADVFNQLDAQGYDLVSSAALSSQSEKFVTKYVFKKDE